MIRWKVFYEGGKTFSSEDGDVTEAPTRGAQVIVQDQKCNGAEFLTGDDYYGWNKGRWQGYDLFGLYDYLLEPGWKRVLFGRMLKQHEYDKIVKQANFEKTGWMPWERRTSD
jgi:hypothetical protein